MTTTEPSNTRPIFYVKELNFSGGETVELERHTKLVVVGPNNAGKSTLLEELRGWCYGELQPALRVLGTITEEVSVDECVAWIRANFTRVEHASSETYSSPFHGHASIHPLTVQGASVDSRVRRAVLGKFCTLLLQVDNRSGLLNEAERLDFSDAAQQPLQCLQRDENLFATFENISVRTFGIKLTLNHGSKHLKVHCGEPPKRGPGQDRVTPAYLAELNKLPVLSRQGHGVRAFLGVALQLLVGQHSLVLIDEPEAHLHPPQARLLGRTVSGIGGERQLIIATHSGTFLRGLLEKADATVTVLRLTREGTLCHARVLNNENVRELWGNSLLRYSNILDGLFHDAVVICEADSDCRFYSAVLDATQDEKEADPAVLFVHCGGKDRMKVAAQALVAVGVPTIVVGDIDILADEEKLEQLLGSVGSGFSEADRKDWATLNSAVSQRASGDTAKDVKSRIRSTLDSVVDKGAFPSSAADAITKCLPKSSPWGELKRSGRNGLPSGEATAAFNRLNERLRAANVFVVGVGELERFVPSVGGHGPEWVAKVLETKDLAMDPELEQARRFVGDIRAAARKGRVTSATTVPHEG